MSLILLFVGAFLAYMGKISFGTFEAEGKHVRAAGVVLMLPLGIRFVLLVIVGMLFGNNVNALAVLVPILNMLDLGLMIAAAVIAYILVWDPPNAPRLPNILGEIQEEMWAEKRGSQASSKPGSSSSSGEHPQGYTPAQHKSQSLQNGPSLYAPQPKPAVDRKSFPRIMNIKQAAQYLQTSEAEIDRLIDDGKLAASRGNRGFVIAKSVLDDLLAEREQAAWNTSNNA